LDNFRKISVEEILTLSLEHPLIDVRTPAEHEKGAIPGSVNIPIFSNPQRAEVGTLYKQKGGLEAICRGLDFVGPEMSALLRKGVELAGENGRLLVHCWQTRVSR